LAKQTAAQSHCVIGAGLLHQGEPRGDPVDEGSGPFRANGRSSSPRISGVHSDLGDDARPNLTVLPEIKREIERWHKSLKSEWIRPGTPFITR